MALHTFEPVSGSHWASLDSASYALSAGKTEVYRNCCDAAWVYDLSGSYGDNAMSRINRNLRSVFSPARRFFDNAARSILFASAARNLADTPDHVFKARGTTRDAAIRNLLNDL